MLGKYGSICRSSAGDRDGEEGFLCKENSYVHSACKMPPGWQNSSVGWTNS